MRWQLVTVVLLGVVLVGGVAWYERSRPPARLVALVAALAALAVAGRLVLAAIPNVVATTDIVLISGYALGAAPGFAVGALAAVVSNLWLGQGPWTPWEMAGWGLVGVGGAALAVLTGRRLGRISLAAACGFAGLAYGALLDLSVMVTYGGEQSLDRYLAISARGVPFNIAHAVGNVVFALAAGPAMVAMISRYRTRFEFSWAGASAACLAAAIAAMVFVPVQEARASPGDARAWLERVQNADGGFGAAPGASSNVYMTEWAALGLEGAGVNPLDVSRGGHDPIGYLRRHADALRSTGELERTILVLEAARVGTHRFAGQDLVAELRSKRSKSGSFEGQVGLTAFGIFALRAAGDPPSSLARSAAWLRRARNGDGGWGYQPSAQSDADSTGAALQGLAAAGRSPASRSIAFLRRIQLSDGGFPLAGSGTSNAQSTAWVVQGLVAAGVAPGSVRRHGHSPLAYLAARQASDGHYRYSSSSDQTPVFVTAQALLAANRQAFPLHPVASTSPTGRAGHGKGASQQGGRGGGEEQAGGSGSVPAIGTTTSTGTVGSRTTRKHPEAHGGGPARGSALGGSGPTAGPAGGDSAGAANGGTPAGEFEPAAGSNDETSPVPFVVAGFALLIAALAAGFLWYRRRLP